MSSWTVLCHSLVRRGGRVYWARLKAAGHRAEIPAWAYPWDPGFEAHPDDEGLDLDDMLALAAYLASLEP